MEKTILVTGASGNIGSLVIPQLLEAGATVRAFVHDKDKASSLGNNVQLFEGDFMNQEALDKAADGVDAILAITPANPDAIKQGNVILNAALKAGSPHFVRLSAIKAAPDAPTANGRLHGESDQILMDSGLPYTIIRPQYYMQNLYVSVDSIKESGNIYWGMGDGKIGMIDVRDIADFAAVILLNDGHEGRIYNPTGPELITFGDTARIIGESIGKPVNYVKMSIEDVGQAILDAGWGEWGSEVMMDYSRAYSEGWGAFLNDEVETITGHKPRSFTEFTNDLLSHALKN